MIKVMAIKEPPGLLDSVCPLNCSLQALVGE
jgi:hypothetical protein